MKTWKHFTVMAFIAIITLAFVTCKDEPEHTHVWGEWVQIKAPTETEEGEETRTCATCGETETRPIDKLPDVAKAQSETVTGLFDNDSSFTVTGFMTNAEWNGVADKIADAHTARFDAAGSVAKDRYRRTYTQEDGVIIIVEKDAEYPNYKTIGDGRTMYLNFAILNDESALQAAVAAASLKLDQKATEMAKATPGQRPVSGTLLA